MGIATCLDAPLNCIPHRPLISRLHLVPSFIVCSRRQPQTTRKNSLKHKWEDSYIKHNFSAFNIEVHASPGDSNDGSSEIYEDGAPFTSELEQAKVALSEAKSRREEIEKERDQLLEGLARSEAMQQEYAATVKHDKDLALQELEAAKSLFDEKLQKSVEEKFALESKLVLAKEDAVGLAVQVEKLAELAFQQATSQIIKEAQLRVSAAETNAAEAAHHAEEQIRNTTEGAISSIIEQSTDIINKALFAAEQATTHAKNAVTALTGGEKLMDEISAVRSENIRLENAVSDLESHLFISKTEVDKMKAKLEQALAQCKASDLRATSTEEALANLQELSRKKDLQREEDFKSVLEKMKKETAERDDAAGKAIKVELQSIMAAVDAAMKTAQLKDQAYIKRCAALERSLKASQAASEVWRQRAETAESILQKQSSCEEETVEYADSGGRIDLLTNSDSQKWKLLAEGPRRELPEWMARRIVTIGQKFPPRKVNISKALSAETLSLNLPKADEVWSIAQEKPRETDVQVERVIEKEVIEKKRKALERSLERKTVKIEKTPEEIKLEPGTGTGREIVLQAFNWESCRRKWYLELAPKAADLSHSGITAVWFPPPTQSVAPQGYMPSDLYNLNSSYGTVEELKQCIEEMHAHNLLALGDVVLNHRCAAKQSPNGVWNIFGGKLAWGPEAIVCDDPNFQGRGNPSTGDIFHAAPNVDHSQEFVRNDIKVWLNWLRSDIGFDGWRLDFARGFWGGYVKEYIETSNPAFAIGEYWDSLAYEGGNLCYNQDAHRQRIVNWINDTGGTSSAFDVTTKGILHSALHNQFWRLIDPQGKPTGVMGWWPSRAVTFLENHDTGSTQGHWPFPREKLEQGYSYILTHPGTPVVFYDHFYDFGLRDTITELIDARRRAGIHCRSAVKIYHANNEGYVARIDESLVLKMGHFGWNPSKENNLDGTWQKFLDKGADYQIWLRQ